MTALGAKMGAGVGTAATGAATATTGAGAKMEAGAVALGIEAGGNGDEGDATAVGDVVERAGRDLGGEANVNAALAEGEEE